MDKLLKYLTKLEELEGLEGGGNEEKKQLYISKINYYYDLVGGWPKWLKLPTWLKLDTRGKHKSNTDDYSTLTNEELAHTMINSIYKNYKWYIRGKQILKYESTQQKIYNKILTVLSTIKFQIIHKNIKILKIHLESLQTHKNWNFTEQIQNIKNSEEKLFRALCTNVLFENELKFDCVNKDSLFNNIGNLVAYLNNTPKNKIYNEYLVNINNLVYDLLDKMEIALNTWNEYYTKKPNLLHPSTHTYDKPNTNTNPSQSLYASVVSNGSKNIPEPTFVQSSSSITLRRDPPPPLHHDPSTTPTTTPLPPPLPPRPLHLR